MFKFLVSMLAILASLCHSRIMVSVLAPGMVGRFKVVYLLDLLVRNNCNQIVHGLSSYQFDNCGGGGSGRLKMDIHPSNVGRDHCSILKTFNKTFFEILLQRQFYHRVSVCQSLARSTLTDYQYQFFLRE